LNFDNDQQRVDQTLFHLLRSCNPDFKENHLAEDENSSFQSVEKAFRELDNQNFAH
jgi:hypothetical protein